MKEFDEERHLDLALAPWPFQSLPGAKSSQWPEGLVDFVQRLDTLEPLALWAEPLDTLPYGLEFSKGAKKFIIDQLERIVKHKDAHLEASTETSEEFKRLCLDLGLGIRAIIGFAVLSANSDGLVEGLELLSRVERDCRLHQALIFDSISSSLRKYLTMIAD